MELASTYEQFIHLSRYARWLEEERRRETWDETVRRYTNYVGGRLDGCIPDGTLKQINKAILNLEVMPSMRALMTAGKALDKSDVAAYNCSFVNIDSTKAFDEILYILMCGVGAGFSVERQHVNKLPIVAEEFYPTETTIVVKDSKIGWASALRELISLLYSGKIPLWDVSGVRPAGARLKTFGGRASGPGPLVDLFNFTIKVFRNAAGRKLNSLECHDVVCKIADIVVCGGVRRSALLSLSNLTDQRMRKAKSGAWWELNPQRALSNNSVCYSERPDMGIFIKEWLALYESKSGERGIFNRVAAQKAAAKSGRRDTEYDFGTNPCSEIILRSLQFCNLTEVVIRHDDTLSSIKEKIRIATIIGTIQSSFTNFKYLRRKWRMNCEEESLLGVSLTGVMDHRFFNGREKLLKDGGNTYTLSEVLTIMREQAVSTNKKWANKIGVNQSTAITCLKPSGTVSQLVNSSSGIHARYSPYYIRTVRADIKDPLARFMTREGFPHEPDVTNPKHTVVFSFPIKSPDNALFRNDLTAIEQLEHWLVYQQSYCEHKPSVTIFVKENEWLGVAAWVWKHFDDISGVSFLPHSDHIYRQAPYQECSKEQFDELIEVLPLDVDWSKLRDFEQEDNTVGMKTYACSANSCEIVDLTKK